MKYERNAKQKDNTRRFLCFAERYNVRVKLQCKTINMIFYISRHLVKVESAYRAPQIIERSFIIITDVQV